MDYGISESVPQRSDREKNEEDFSVATIANEIDRRCKLHEEEFRGGKGHVSPFEQEQRIAEDMQKKTVCGFP